MLLIIRQQLADTLGVPVEYIVITDISVGSLRVNFFITRPASRPISDSAILSILSQTPTYSNALDLYYNITNETSPGVTEPVIIGSVSTTSGANCDGRCIGLAVGLTVGLVLVAVIAVACVLNHLKGKRRSREPVEFDADCGAVEFEPTAEPVH
jgi:hypothetical protein